MDLESHFVGASAARTQRERLGAAVLVIGADTFTREDLARVRCFCFQAAAALSAHVQSLRVKSTHDLFARIHPTRLAARGIGDVANIVLGAAFKAKGIGGARPLDAWVTHHEMKAITFATMKRTKRPPSRSRARRRASVSGVTSRAADRISHGER